MYRTLRTDTAARFAAKENHHLKRQGCLTAEYAERLARQAALHETLAGGGRRKRVLKGCE